MDFKLGQRVVRIEDERFLRGEGRYTSDFSFPKEARLYIVRSTHAHARLKSVDTEQAKSAPGVLAVLTGKDLAADAIGGIPSRGRKTAPDGTPNFEPPYPALVNDKVVMLGDAIVAVVAETLNDAKSAADLVSIDYEELPAVAGLADAAAVGADTVWEEAPGNVCYTDDIGDRERVDQAIANASHVVKQRFVISRVSANALELRSAVGVYDEKRGQYTLYSGVQTPHVIRQELAESIFRVKMEQVRVVSPDMGGAFGSRGALFPEHILVLWAARKVDRPVKWITDRSEAFVAEYHARDNISDVTLALDKKMNFLALRVETWANLGGRIASNGLMVPPGNVGGLAGTYMTPAIHVSLKVMFSNTRPTCPYRGAGRPEASYCIERIIDVAAKQLGVDPIALRRRNMIPPEAMPFKTGLIFTYDTGEFERCMDKALVLADWGGALKRRAAARRRNRIYGLGVASAIEMASGPSPKPSDEGAEIRFDQEGCATLFVGGHNHGQGHETSFRQMMNHLFALPPDRVAVKFGDTSEVFYGKGTFGSRTMSTGGLAVSHAADKIVEQGKAVAGKLLEAATMDIEFHEGQFRVSGTDRAVTLAAVAKASFEASGTGLAASAISAPNAPNFPNGFHVCELEIEPETGKVTIHRYAVVDDVGTVINPLLLEGQLHGGIGQGSGQALGEQVVHDVEGQMLSGSFMDYRMPRAGDLPCIVIGSHPVPTKTNPLGTKGAGEAGCVGSLPVVMNAINDALAPLGITNFDMPASPGRLWAAIAGAKSGAKL